MLLDGVSIVILGVIESTENVTTELFTWPAESLVQIVILCWPSDHATSVMLVVQLARVILEENESLLYQQDSRLVSAAK